MQKSNSQIPNKKSIFNEKMQKIVISNKKIILIPNPTIEFHQR